MPPPEVSWYAPLASPLCQDIFLQRWPQLSLKLCCLPRVKNADHTVTDDNDKISPCSCLSVVKFLRARSDGFALCLQFPKLAHTAIMGNWRTIPILRYCSHPRHIWIMCEVLFLWHFFLSVLGQFVMCSYISVHYSKSPTSSRIVLKQNRLADQKKDWKGTIRREMLWNWQTFGFKLKYGWVHLQSGNFLGIFLTFWKM